MVRMKREMRSENLNPSTSKLATLRSTVEFAGCSTSALASLLQYVDEVTVATGTRIAVRGETCNQLVIVAEGRLRASSRDDGWHSLLPGETVGWDAMWDGTENEATVVAETEARLLAMGHAQFRAVKAIVERRVNVPVEKLMLGARIHRAPDSNRRAPLRAD
jgi:CRP-like cAMP-binding protein